MKNYEFKLTPAYCLYNGIAVKKQQGSKICFLAENPDNTIVRERVTKAFKNYLEYVNRQQDCPLEYKSKPSVHFVSGNREELRMQVSHLYSEKNISVETQTSNNQKDNIRKKESEAAAVLLLDTIMADARNRNATDIHIEKNNVRFRILGKLEPVTTLTEDKCQELIQRVKFLAGMNVLEKRKSQDGHFIYGTTNTVFVRVSTVCVVGSNNSDSEESVVIRLLDTKRLPLSIEHLGFNQKQILKIKKISEIKNGLVIICGPTGAGKSTTVASILIDIEKNKRNSIKIISLEDPPEYLIPGVTQIQIDEKIDNSFSDALMHVFRQDPDVLMIGEIRDKSSAAVAIRAALTGHLVFATLHASSAAGVILRLEDLGIPRNLIVSVLKGVVVQELNTFQGNVNLIADVGIPTSSLMKNCDKQITEDELESFFEHETNYNQVLSKTIDVLKEKHSMDSEKKEDSFIQEKLELSKTQKMNSNNSKSVFVGTKIQTKDEEAVV